MSEDHPALSSPVGIGRRIIAVCEKFGYLQTEATMIDHQYRAISYDKLIASIRGHLTLVGINVVPALVSGQTVVTGKTTQKGAPIVRFEGVYDVHFISADNMHDRYTARIPGHGEDTGDKAPGKASTYAVKGAITKVFLIESGDEEESRIQGDPEKTLTATELADFYTSMDNATDVQSLRDILKAALQAAVDRGDTTSPQDLLDHSVKAAKKFPAVAMPEATDEKAPAAKETTATRGAPAPASLLKMLEAALKEKPAAREALLKARGVDDIKALDKAEVQSALKKILDHNAGPKK